MNTYVLMPSSIIILIPLSYVSNRTILHMRHHHIFYIIFPLLLSCKLTMIFFMFFCCTLELLRSVWINFSDPD